MGEKRELTEAEKEWLKTMSRNRRFSTWVIALTIVAFIAVFVYYVFRAH